MYVMPTFGGRPCETNNTVKSLAQLLPVRRSSSPRYALQLSLLTFWPAVFSPCSDLLWTAWQAKWYIQREHGNTYSQIGVCCVSEASCWIIHGKQQYCYCTVKTFRSWELHIMVQLHELLLLLLIQDHQSFASNPQHLQVLCCNFFFYISSHILKYVMAWYSVFNSFPFLKPLLKNSGWRSMMHI